MHFWAPHFKRGKELLERVQRRLRGREGLEHLCAKERLRALELLLRSPREFPMNQPFTGSRATPVILLTRWGGCCFPILLSCSFLCSFPLLHVTQSHLCTQISTVGELRRQQGKKKYTKPQKSVVTHQANEKFYCHDYCLKPFVKGCSHGQHPNLGCFWAFSCHWPGRPCPATQTPRRGRCLVVHLQMQMSESMGDGYLKSPVINIFPIMRLRLSPPFTLCHLVSVWRPAGINRAIKHPESSAGTGRFTKDLDPSFTDSSFCYCLLLLPGLLIQWKH